MNKFIFLNILIIFVICSIVSSDDTLKSKTNKIYIGTALAPQTLATDPQYKTIAEQQFNCLTPENSMKWESIEKVRGQSNYTNADKLVAFGQQNNMYIRGHTLIWHNQLPDWVQSLEHNKAELEQELQKHITEEVSHFGSKIYAWNVLNEIFNDDGTFRDTIWYRVFGPDFVTLALRTAYDANPHPDLYINDYSIEAKNAKSDALYALVKKLKAGRVPIDGIGMQAHLEVGQVPKGIKENIQRFVDLGVKVAVTELDIRIKLPSTPELIAKQTEDYAQVYSDCISVSGCVGVTVWGFTDKYSWITSQMKGYGEADLWDKDYKPKPAIDAIKKVLSSNDTTLKSQTNKIYIGTALAPQRLPTDPQYKTIAEQQFNCLTPENSMKWESIEKVRGQSNYTNADKLVAFGQQNNMKIRGHNLVWHQQLPDWVLSLEHNKAELEQELQKHIIEEVSHFKGKIYAWDVLNEVLNEDGTFRDTIWYRNFGQDFVALALRTAYEADSHPYLYINDYNIESKNAKSDALYALVKSLKAKHVPIDGVGIQAHLEVGGVPKDFKENIQRFVDLGVKVAITELDIRIKLPSTPELIAKQTEDYAQVYSDCLSVSGCVGVTVWGFTDKYSWIPDFMKGYGEADLWDKDYKPKPAIDAIKNVLSK